LIFVNPALPSSSDRIVLQISSSCELRILTPLINGHSINIEIDTSFPPPPCPPPVASLTLLDFELPSLEPGGYRVVQVIDGTPSPNILEFQVRPPTHGVLLLDAHFLVTANWIYPGVGTPALIPADAVRLSDQAGYLWFFDRATPEITVKMIDGRPVNGHYWLFLAGTTDIAWVVTVTDLWFPAFCTLTGNPPCLTKTYSSAGGTVQNIVDLAYWADFP
jgi:hypothetical protein